MQALLFSPHDDETSVFQLILQQTGFVVRTTQSLDQAIQAWPEHPADLVFIATLVNHEKALAQIRQMRGHTSSPIIVVSDPLIDDLQVRYLEAGADLFVTRPYSVRFLLAQIRALLRRTTGIPFSSLPTLQRGEIQLDPASRSVIVRGGEPIRLTQLEFRLIYTLMIRAGQIIPTDQIVEHVWGYAGEGNRELVRGLVQRLRAKIEANPRTPQYILTESGIGYSFVQHPDGT